MRTSHASTTLHLPDEPHPGKIRRSQAAILLFRLLAGNKNSSLVCQPSPATDYVSTKSVHHRPAALFQSNVRLFLYFISFSFLSIIYLFHRPLATQPFMVSSSFCQSSCRQRIASCLFYSWGGTWLHILRVPWLRFISLPCDNPHKPHSLFWTRRPSHNSDP